jgi:hypothetical protein
MHVLIDFKDQLTEWRKRNSSGKHKKITIGLFLPKIERSLNNADPSALRWIPYIATPKDAKS